MGVVITGGVQYDVVNIDLSDSHDDEMLMLTGRSISVLSRTGTLEIRLNHLRNPLMSMDEVENISAVEDFFDAVYFTNTAQAGLAVKLLITRLAGVTARARLGDVNIDKIGGTVQSGADLTPYRKPPTAIVEGIKSGITTTAAKLCSSSTPLKKGGLIKVRSLGTGSYIAVGNVTSQNFRMDAVKDTLAIDFVDDCDKIYVITDAGNTGVVEFIGG
jgi:hypothetical protein